MILGHGKGNIDYTYTFINSFSLLYQPNSRLSRIGEHDELLFIVLNSVCIAFISRELLGSVGAAVFMISMLFM